MPKCPWCGSTAQPNVKATDYIEDGWSLEVVRYCLCGCGRAFIAKSWYKSEGYEEVEPFSKSAIERRR